MSRNQLLARAVMAVEAANFSLSNFSFNPDEAITEARFSLVEAIDFLDKIQPKTPAVDFAAIDMAIRRQTEVAK